ncbi:MAG: hypothetical protein KF894_29675 [Labilithrix sp.]|nr:hypothetical protein [Labilithrix sp.]
MQQEELDWGHGHRPSHDAASSRQLNGTQKELRGAVVFASVEEQSQLCTELLGAGALLVTVPPPGQDMRGRLGEVLEELVERELARMGAPSPYLAAWSAMPEDAQARLADQLFRARTVGATGIALAVGSLRALAAVALTPDDSATLRWLADTAEDAPLVLLLDDADLSLAGYAAPHPLGSLLASRAPTWGATTPSSVVVVGPAGSETDVAHEEIDALEVDATGFPDDDGPILLAGDDATMNDARVSSIDAGEAILLAAAPPPSRAEGPVEEATAEHAASVGPAPEPLIVPGIVAETVRAEPTRADTTDATRADAPRADASVAPRAGATDATGADATDATDATGADATDATGADASDTTRAGTTDTTDAGASDAPRADTSDAHPRALVEASLPVAEAPPTTPDVAATEPRISARERRTSRRASAGVPRSGPSDAWRSWAIALSAARGAQPLAAFERLFAESYVPLANAVASGLDDPRALRAFDDFRRSFERSYTDAFTAFGATNRRPRLVMDAYDIASKQARLSNARSSHVLLVDSMRFDLGCLVRDVLAREATGIATLTSETLLWSALPSTTMRQIETFARGLDALRAPAREEPAESLRGRAAEVVRRLRVGSRELYKLDLIPSMLDGTADVVGSLESIATATAEALARHIATLPPRTLLFVVGDHGFSVDRRGELRTGGASPEEVLVPAFSWLIGELH